jgi:carbamoyltransferase
VTWSRKFATRGDAALAFIQDELVIILGLNAFHADSAAALIRDGRLLAAAEEERFRRIKHWAGFPSQAIAYCLAEAGIEIGDVDHVAFNQNNNANLLRKLLYVLRARPDVKLVMDRIRNRRARLSIPELLRQAFPRHSIRAKFHAIEHHLAHLSSAFHVSPFEKAAVASIDGFGDFSSAAWGVGSGTEISEYGRVYFPHSLGIFYQAITQYLGFPNYGDEYKVMGLAPYGQPSMMTEMRDLVRHFPEGRFELNLDYFRHHQENVAYEWTGGIPDYGSLYSPALEGLLGRARVADEPLKQRHYDIARSAQLVYEEAFFHLLTNLQQRSGLYDVALAGGCAMNSVANGKIRRSTPFRRVYVQAAAGDAGGAIGAAFATWHGVGGKRTFAMDHAYWGPSFSDGDIENILNSYQSEISNSDCRVEYVPQEAELCKITAKHIADGLVVGWFQGRMEWGPRALGNRSILCDPRRGNMKELLNAKIKRRESFRPFAPSILEENVSDWFEEDDAVPFMMQVFQIRDDKRMRVPAVTHVDGSGRLQTVSQVTNPRYHCLISNFCALTQVPMILNTSFNENEPVVCTPQQALGCFFRTKMDLLVLGNRIIRRDQGSALKDD